MRKKVRKKAENVFEDDPPLPAVQEESPLLKDLGEVDKEKFAKLLRTKMSLEDRADLLIELAGHTDTKRAPVALRAIQEINAITGIKDDRPNEAIPLFTLPPRTAVAIKVFEPEE
jgi:hypothetical protein